MLGDNKRGNYRVEGSLRFYGSAGISSEGDVAVGEDDLNGTRAYVQATSV